MGCPQLPHKINAGKCKARAKGDNKPERSNNKEHSPQKKYCFDCFRKGFVLLNKGATCSGSKEALAPKKTCTVGECAKLCLENDDCQYFSLGRTEGTRGKCMWEHTTTACKGKDESFNKEGYDFFSVCRKANDENAPFKCKKEPHPLKAGECKAGRPGDGGDK